jgi:hypothetical protein
MTYVILVKDLSTEQIEVHAAYEYRSDAETEMERAMTEWEEQRSFKIVEFDEKGV